MRIRELFESSVFDEKNFVKDVEGGRELDFDLAEDLMHYMNHDDSIYRRHLYPSIAKCIDITERKKKPAKSIFKSAVEEGYKKYVQKYPIRELPESLDEETLGNICDKIREEVCKDIADGKYK